MNLTPFRIKMSGRGIFDKYIDMNNNISAEVNPEKAEVEIEKRRKGKSCKILPQDMGIDHVRRGR